jgi:hypothetical protein
LVLLAILSECLFELTVVLELNYPCIAGCRNRAQNKIFISSKNSALAFRLTDLIEVDAT